MWTVLEEMTYEAWLERQSELAKKALELIQKSKFRAVIIEQENKLSFIRMYIADKSIDFHIKEIKSKFARDVWICKKDDFVSKDNYLVFQKDVERWVILAGRKIEQEAEIRDSSYRKGEKWLVVPMDIFRSARQFFKLIRKRYEEQLQLRLDQF